MSYPRYLNPSFLISGISVPARIRLFPYPTHHLPKHSINNLPNVILGARDKKYYTSIREHPFFKGLDFENLQRHAPAALDNFVKDGDIPDPVWAKCPDLKPGVGRMLDLMVGHTSSDEELLDVSPDGPGPGGLRMPLGGPGPSGGPSRSRSKKSVLRPLTELSEEERAEKLKQQSLTNDYHKFVEGHLILKQGKSL